VATTLAGDAEMKQLLVGTWKESFPYGVTTIVLKSDGSRIDNGHDYPSGKPYSISGKWDVKDGNLSKYAIILKAIVITPSSLSRNTSSCLRITPTVAILELGRGDLFTV